MPDRGDGGQRPAFGRIDPFVWFPVLALLVVAVVLVIGAAATYAIIPVLVAVGLVVLDARMNRPLPGSRRSR